MLQLLVAWSPGELRVAVEDAGMLVDYAIHRPGAPDGVGDLHRGRVSAVVPAMAGAFVTLQHAEGFLPDSEGAKGSSVGQAIGVRITRAAQGDKGPRLSGRLASEDRDRIGSGPPAVVARGPGAVERFARQYPAAAIMVDDAATMAALSSALRERSKLVPKAFDEELEDQIEALGEPEIRLISGARLLIFPTPALVAIDVDAGSAVGERAGKLARHLGVNRAMVPELARQVRLRNLSGAILVDFAGLSARRRGSLGPELATALSDDPLRPRFLGFTHLGMAEIVRTRIHPPLHELLTGSHAAGLEALRRIARDQESRVSRAPVLRAAPAVIEALERDTMALPEFTRCTGRALVLRSDPSLPMTGWVVEAPHG